MRDCDEGRPAAGRRGPSTGGLLTTAAMAERTDEPYAFLASHKTDVAHPSDQSFIDHLTGVEAIMLTWAAVEPELYPAATAASGLYHSIYGTEGFQGFTLPLEQREVSREGAPLQTHAQHLPSHPAASRSRTPPPFSPAEPAQVVRGLIGERAELSAYFNCVMDRSSFDDIVIALAAAHPDGLRAALPSGGLLLDSTDCGTLTARKNEAVGMSGEEEWALAGANVWDMCAINVADRLEGWDVAMQMGPDDRVCAPPLPNPTN